MIFICIYIYVYIHYMNFVYKTGFSGRNLFGLGKYGPSSHGFVPEQQRFVAAICPTFLHPANLSELIPKIMEAMKKITKILV